MLRLIGSIIGALLDHGHGRCVRREAPACCADERLLARGSAVNAVLKRRSSASAETASRKLNIASVVGSIHRHAARLDLPARFAISAGRNFARYSGVTHGKRLLTGCP